jgi:uncharacterized hydantoinase/oxoprolinase family protein
MTLEEAREIARELANRQIDQISSAIDAVVERMNAPCPTVVVSGSGEFLASSAVDRSDALRSAELHSLGLALGADHASAACAFALARLARERVQ